MIKDKNISIIKKVISKYNPEKVILFGSRAKQNENKFSDYDLLTIFHKKLNQIEKFAIANKIRKELAKYLIDADIIVKSTDELKTGKDEIGNILKNAYYEGINLL